MYIKVRVTAGAKKELVKKVSDDTYEMSVREKAEGGAANARVGSILSGVYMKNGRKPRIRIVSGHHSAHKILSITHEVSAVEL
jgi:uncharacterized protein YggU (UPF0235/DUF167 family)